MLLLSAHHLSKSFGARTLFSDLSFRLDTGDRVGLVGENGCGKTTLFKLLTGEMTPDSGQIVPARGLEIGYMEQLLPASLERTLQEELLTAFDDLREMEREMERVNAMLRVSEDAALIRRQQELQEAYAEGGGYTYQSRVQSTLRGLGFSEADMALPLQALSGGQRSKALLGKLLLQKAPLMLLDEPTNHLDMDAVEWLEDYLLSCGRAFMVISHDRYFLDKVTQRTMQISNGRLYGFAGNYSAFMEKRQAEKAAEQRHYENTVREIERIEGIVRQQRQWNREKNIRTAESKLKQIERLKEGMELPEAELQSISFRFSAPPPGGNDVLTVNELSMGFGEKKLFSGVDMAIKRGERVFLLGPNGCGKTTLLKLLIGELRPNGGRIRLGSRIKTAYFDQLQSHLDTGRTILAYFTDEFPARTQTELRSGLARFLFRGDDVEKRIASLSGGERARLELLRLLLSGANFLLLDEPTNHLDILSKETVEQALLDYDGSMLVVSHDRYLINRLADRICYLTPDGLLEHEGNYDSFLASRRLPETPAAAAAEPQQKAAAADYRRSKERQALLRKLGRAVEKKEAEIEQAETALAELRSELARPEVATDYEAAMRLAKEAEKAEAALEALYADWEAAQQALNEAEAAE